MADGSFSERARESITQRGFGLCQGCYSRQVRECHHRRPRGKGGTSDPLAGHPANGLGLCGRCHAWAESHRADALVLGWLVPQGIDPREVPTFLTLPYGRRWYQLLDDGTVGFLHDRPPPDVHLPGP